MTCANLSLLMVLTHPYSYLRNMNTGQNTAGSISPKGEIDSEQNQAVIASQLLSSWK